MNYDEFMAAWEASLIKHEQSLWAEITRREKSFLGRLKRWWYRSLLSMKNNAVR